MIYTLGLRETYDESLRTQPIVHKLGRRGDYPGGSVWRTVAEAEAYRQSKGLNDFGVYGVLADWETDTVQNPEGSWHDLLIDAQIVAVAAA